MIGQKRCFRRQAFKDSRPNYAGRGGFTLMELAMVVTILAIIMAAGLPNFSRFQRKAAISAEGAKLIQTLRYAHQRAILERQPMQVIFDLDKKTYWVPRVKEKVRRQQGQGRVRTSRRQKELKSFQHKLKNDYDFDLFYYPSRDREITRDEASIHFYPDGTADAVYVTLVKTNDDPEKELRIFIKVMGTTGEIKSYVAREESEGWDFYDGRFDEKGAMS